MFEILTWLWWITINTILFSMIYHCVIKYWSHFSDRNMKFVRGMPFFGTTYKILLGFAAVHDEFERIYSRWGDESVIGIYELGGSPVYMIRDPELIKQIAIKDFDCFINRRFHISTELNPLLGRSMFVLKDQKWKDMRSTLSPAFTVSKMRLMFDLVTECAQEFCSHLKNEIKTKPVVYDSIDLFQRVATDMIGTSAFGIKVNSLKDRNNDFFKMGQALTNFEGLNALKFVAYMSIPTIMKLLRIRFLLSDEDTAYLRQMVHSNMEYREANNIVRPDMIHLLMEAKNGILQHDNVKEMDDDAGFATVQESDVGKSSRKLQKWEDDDFTAQCVLFFLAGLNTASAASSFMAYELAVNPDIQEKLYREIHQVWSQLDGSKLTYEVLQKMNYMDCVVSETLRRWTLLPTHERAVNKPCVLVDDKGKKIQFNVGDGVLFPSGAIHMDPKYYPNPKLFDPERFNNHNKHNIRPCTYFPFGIGPRNCIASRFALMEMKSLFFYLIKSYAIEPCSKTQHPLKLKKNTASTTCEKGFWIQIRNRTE